MNLLSKNRLTLLFTGIFVFILAFQLTDMNPVDDFRQGIDPRDSQQTSGNFNRSNFTDREQRIYRDAYSRGRKIGYSLGRHQSSIEKEELFNSSAETAETAENLEMAGYKFFFGDVKGIYSGISWPENDTVKLELAELETVGEVETMCDHEIAHQLFPDFRHPVEKSEMLKDPIYRYSDDMDIRVCDRLAANVTR